MIYQFWDLCNLVSTSWNSCLFATKRKMKLDSDYTIFAWITVPVTFWAQNDLKGVTAEIWRLQLSRWRRLSNACSPHGGFKAQQSHWNTTSWDVLDSKGEHWGLASGQNDQSPNMSKYQIQSGSWDLANVEWWEKDIDEVQQLSLAFSWGAQLPSSPIQLLNKGRPWQSATSGIQENCCQKSIENLEQKYTEILSIKCWDINLSYLYNLHQMFMILNLEVSEPLVSHDTNLHCEWNSHSRPAFLKACRDISSCHAPYREPVLTDSAGCFPAQLPISSQLWQLLSEWCQVKSYRYITRETAMQRYLM